MKHFSALDAARRQPHCRTAASRAPRERREGEGGRRHAIKGQHQICFEIDHYFIHQVRLRCVGDRRSGSNLTERVHVLFLVPWCVFHRGQSRKHQFDLRAKCWTRPVCVLNMSHKTDSFFFFLPHSDVGGDVFSCVWQTSPL